jgi:hypothetical protein
MYGQGTEWPEAPGRRDGNASKFLTGEEAEEFDRGGGKVRRQGSWEGKDRPSGHWKGVCLGRPPLAGPVRGRACRRQSLTLGTRLQSYIFATWAVSQRPAQAPARTGILSNAAKGASSFRSHARISIHLARRCCSAADRASPMRAPSGRA